MIAFDGFRIRQSTYAPGLRQQRHTHDYSNVTIVLAGQLEEATDRGQYCARPFSVVAKAAGWEHEDRVSGYGAKTLSIELQPGAVSSWSWLDRPDVVCSAIAVYRAFERGDRDALEQTAVALVEQTTSVPTTRTPPSWLAELRQTLDQRFDEPIRFEQLARDFGRHPVYVSRAFRRHTGMSMTDYVRAARLRHARHGLSSSRRSVASIAAESGFADSSHLCRTFSSLLRVTPTTYREITAS